METKAKKIFNEYKTREIKKRRKTCFIIFSIMAIVIFLSAAICAICCGISIGVMVIIVGVILILFTSLLIFLIFKSSFNSNFKECCIDGIEIAAFIGYEKTMPLGITIHLIINGKEFVRFIEYKTYYNCDNMLNIFEVFRYINDKIEDKKKGLNIVKLTKKVNDKKISVVYEKYLY